jgi:hypothetical protein
MKIPSSFRLMGHKVTVEQIPPIKWKHKDCVGIFKPQDLKIEIRKGKGTGPAHTFAHELTHAILSALNHPLNDDEAFVDNFAGLLHQALSTAEYK